MPITVEKIRIRPPEYSIATCVGIIRELVQQTSEKQLTDIAIRNYINIAKSEIYTRLKLWLHPFYSVVFSTNHEDIDSKTGLYRLAMPGITPIYSNSNTSIGNIDLSGNIIAVNSVSYETYGACKQSDMNTLLHYRHSRNDMMNKEIYFAFVNDAIYVFNGPETVKTSSTVDVFADGERLEEHTRYDSGILKEFSYTKDRKNLSYFVECSREPVIDDVFNSSSNTLNYPVDIPSSYIRLLFDITQFLCLSNLTGKPDPNMEILINNQINSILNIGGQDVQNS